MKRDDDRGASAVEYGLMVAAIAATIVGLVFGLGTLVRESLYKTCSTMAVGPASLGDPVADCGGTTTGNDTTTTDPGDTTPVDPNR